MGSPVSQVAQSTQPQGKGAASPQPNNSQQAMMAPAVMPQPSGKGGRITYSGQSGQPQMGQPNQYSNTVGPWDNAAIGNQQPQTFGSGKGKGG